LARDRLIFEPVRTSGNTGEWFEVQAGGIYLMARRKRVDRLFSKQYASTSIISPFVESHADARVFALAVNNEGRYEADRITPDGACALRVAVYVLIYCSDYRRGDWKDWDLPVIRSTELLEKLYSLLGSVELTERTRSALERFKGRSSFPMDIWLSNFHLCEIFQAKKIRCNMWECVTDSPSKCTLMTDGISELNFSVADLL
jgi:hypothetical protein